MSHPPISYYVLIYNNMKQFDKETPVALLKSEAVCLESQEYQAKQTPDKLTNRVKNEHDLTSD